MNQIEHKVLRFDRFTLDLTRGCLRSGGHEIELRPKAFHVLSHLVLNAGRLISKQELIEAVWPDVTVTDESLVQCIRELRQKLGDDRHQLIKTLPRRGYMLDAAVTASDARALPPPRAGFIPALPALAIRLWPAIGAARRLQAGYVGLAAGSLAGIALLAVYLLLPAPAPTAGWGPSVAQLPPASALFTARDASRVAAVAASKELPLPAFQMLTPAPGVPDEARRFVGVWVSDTGWMKSNRQLMLIVTSVGPDGVAEGYRVDGPPQPKSYAQRPASAVPFRAVVSGRALLFASGNDRYSAALTMQGRIELKLMRRDGTTAAVSLDPVWTLAEVERAASPTARRPD